ncbi:MAG: hypothetical protein ACRC10_06010 [Thermoguttaceae bacterium]
MEQQRRNGEERRIQPYSVVGSVLALIFLLLPIQTALTQEQATPLTPPASPLIPQEETVLALPNTPSPNGSRWSFPTQLPNFQRFLPSQLNGPPPAELSAIPLPGFSGRFVQPDQNGALFPQQNSQPFYSDPELDSMVADFSGNSPMYFPLRDEKEPITISARSGWSKTVERLEVYILEGECTIQQGLDVVRGDHAVIWLDMDSVPQSATVYLESTDPKKPLQIDLAQGKEDARIVDQTWCGTFRTTQKMDIVLQKRTLPLEKMPPIYTRAHQMRFPQTSGYRNMQMTEYQGGEGSNFKKIQFFWRSDSPTEITWRTDPLTNRSVGLLTNGFTLVIDGVKLAESTGDPQGGRVLSGDTLDISADRAVIWTANLNDLMSRGEPVSVENLDLEIYLEGNIVFLEGTRSIFANRMYYDVKNRIGYILNGELLSPVPGYDGLLRLKADVMQQIGPNLYQASNAYVTTSRLGEPAYRIQSQRMTLSETSSPLFDSLTGAPVRDPISGGAAMQKKQMLTSENNLICVGNVPIFYWPWLAADLQYKDAFLYIRDFSVANDNIFGTQVRTVWNPYQIFNIKNRPEGTDWDISLDYFSKRGLGLGTNFVYSRGDFFGIPGPTAGMVDYWGIYDNGQDNLGLDRRSLTPDAKYRYRALWRHRQEFRNQWFVTAEIGKMSDLRFMEQYFETEWDTQKNLSTDVELKKLMNNSSLGIFASARLDGFQTETSWFPRFDHFWIGQSLLEDTFTWYEHTRVGLAQFKTADRPQNVNTTKEHDENYYYYLPWELATGSTNNPNDPTTLGLDRTGEVISTKHELDLPFNLGPVRVVPYVLGEAAHWGSDMEGHSVQRLYYQAGVRTNLPIWKLMPGFSSRTWYANGLAHKVDFVGEFSYAKSNVDWEDLVMYDALDDFSVQNARRRMLYTTFGGNTPGIFDERYYAIRSGMGGNVASPVEELVGDLTRFRLGVENRWQTKRGSVGNRRIIDWIVFNTHVNLYPDNTQNFNETIGLLDYDFRWHVGDRFVLLSSGLFDMFTIQSTPTAGPNQGEVLTYNGQKIFRIGGLTERPGRGSLYLGLDKYDGPFDAAYLSMILSYQMNEKYSAKIGTSYNLTSRASGGGMMQVKRAGESFAWIFGVSFDPSRDSFGVNLSLEPVFLSKIGSRRSSGMNP